MQYYQFLTEEESDRLFYRIPRPFFRDSDKELLRTSLGALLYIPADREDIAQLLIASKITGAAAVCICLEDAIGDGVRKKSMSNLKRQTALLEEALEEGRINRERLPLIFVRVKDVPMLEALQDFFSGHAEILAGAVFPKVTLDSLPRYLELTAQINRKSTQIFYAMPIIESAEFITSTDRLRTLREYRDIVSRYGRYVLNIRVGATDLCGMYGIRRRKSTHVHNIGIMRSCMEDIIRVFAFRDEYTVSGPVWEYFTSVQEIERTGSYEEIEFLMKETALNLENGMLGKTAVHPMQLVPIQSVHTVDYEQYIDAKSIAEADPDRNGVISSDYHNKMNELRPHEIWANKILKRAQTFGVYRPDTGCRELVELFLKHEHERRIGAANLVEEPMRQIRASAEEGDA
ncbi:HpcH/HpaI aldolase/citrate lyase family protein [Candidatus Soleaferrea massiliensis]|uniref:HpcH/HpaI aldolase/citrate lyase family protein n=1 Tax=Candidatus Soleaferrea massiliensis TaxID=1470354 RepID=UPI00058DD040|nr:HpcH/HpaI aldolase/citrate lyase family protein [Candidatus Soleaferrea massiliensis]